jgi:predicted short-subunit dehydrogenase-like oxidoreductase (DUF2520 family)
LNKKYKNVIIIGAGKIAYSIIPALQISGFVIRSIISRKIDSAKSLAVKTGTRHYTNKLNEINIDNGIVFLCVPDNQIKTVAEELSRLKLVFGNFIFVHLSGAQDISCLNSLKKKKGLTASLHIMQTFPSKRRISIKGCYSAVETGSKEAEKILFNLAMAVALKPFRLKSNAKVFYHLAGVFASNFLAGNLYSAGAVFNKTGNNNIDFFELISPIISSTLSNIKKSGSVNALSGPVERGDIQTIKTHLSVLKKDSLKTNNKSLLLSYIAQSLNLLEVAEKKHGGSDEIYKLIRELLIKTL